MKYLTSLAVCLFAVLVVGLAWEQRTVGKEPQAARGAIKSESDSHVEERESLKLPIKEPRIVIFKSKRQLELYSNGVVVRTYRVGLGLNPVDDKQREGDRATPEGEFYIFTKNPKSAYYLSLGISYPNIEDAERGLRAGLITRAQRDRIVSAINKKAAPPQYTALGGLIYIHGNGAGSDWTWGCVALENEDIQELYKSVDIGTPVTMKP
ncbi:MAG: L,D-transpeptidase [Pyrinomonadaceae bacterium]|jgi:murein L,D-transpeptidase YafK|nr:L,D-transpeptidase [Pyrinomonadaceae bacterium]